MTDEKSTSKKTVATSKWGRYSNGNDRKTILLTLLIPIFCPFLVLYFWSSCYYYHCSLWLPIANLLKYGDFYQFFRLLFPKFSSTALAYYFGWMAFQAILYAFVPAQIGYGQVTPAGYKLPYKVNGLKAWILSHALFAALVLRDDISPSVIYDNWGGLLVAANIYGYLLSVFVYLKALYFPSHLEDRKFSGSFIYDFFMGIEFNPRLGKLWDFKLFHNGRPGIIAWTLINFSFMHAQHEKHGYVSDSMILVNMLQLIYVLDFFVNEDWYLRTIDIAHDHFGWMLAWGDSVWLPFMYTLQSQYLVRHPVDLGPTKLFLIFSLGIAGYCIFRAVNNQKNLARKNDGNCFIWRKPAKYILAEYKSHDNTVHKTVILCSGFWGLSRHFNYVGDLCLSLAFCLCCGSQHLLPYFYIVFMTILLLHRVNRDHVRCSEKYGSKWNEYCKLVPYKLIPYVY